MNLKRNAKTSGAESLGNAPGTAYARAAKQWFERMGEPIVERNRWFLMSAFLAVCLGGTIFAIGAMAPLKTVVPYVIKVDQVTGEVLAQKVTGDSFKPDEKAKKYFLVKWVKQILDIEPSMTERNLREAFSFVRGKAIDEYRDYIGKTKPLARLREEKTLTRKTEIISFNFGREADNVATIRFQTEERQAGVTPVIKRYNALITYEIVPPQTDKEIIENPLGIFITHFSIAEEINQ